MNKNYLDYLITALLIIIVIALIITVNKKVKEDFTEIYFNDYINLQKYSSDSGNFSFSIHNMENSEYEYDVVISAEIYDSTNSTEPYDVVNIDSFNITLKNDETKIFNQEFDLLNFKKAKIKASIKDQTQDIHFWTFYAEEFLKYEGIGYGMLDCLKETNVQPFTQIKVYAKGEYAQGWPTMEIWFDGKNIRTLDVKSNETEEYSFDVDGSEGIHVIDITFINDFYVDNDEDRNLYIEKVKINNKEITSQDFTRDIGSKEEGIDCQDITNSGALYSSGNIRLILNV